MRNCCSLVTLTPFCISFVTICACDVPFFCSFCTNSIIFESDIDCAMAFVMAMMLIKAMIRIRFIIVFSFFCKIVYGKAGALSLYRITERRLVYFITVAKIMQTECKVSANRMQ